MNTDADRETRDVKRKGQYVDRGGEVVVEIEI
jgi:hypothetical protein